MAPYVAINFMVYETLRGVFANLNVNNQPTVAQKLLCGALAGASAQTGTLFFIFHFLSFLFNDFLLFVLFCLFL